MSYLTYVIIINDNIKLTIKLLVYTIKLLISENTVKFYQKVSRKKYCLNKLVLIATLKYFKLVFALIIVIIRII